MPRKPATTPIDFYRGTFFGPLITPWKTAAGNLVEKNYKNSRPYPFDYLFGYVTTAADIQINAPSFNNYGFTPAINFSVADVLAIPSGVTPNFSIVQIDELFPFDGDHYMRLWVVKYPCTWNNPPDC